MAIAVLIGVGLGMLTYRHPFPSSLATTTTSAFLTIPSIALLGILIGPLGLGTANVLLALVLYELAGYAVRPRPLLSSPLAAE